METEGSVTLWIDALKSGDATAARELWGRYFGRLVYLARDQLRHARHGGTIRNEEDAALSALACVFLGATEGKFPQLSDRDELWRLLVETGPNRVLTIEPCFGYLGRSLDRAGRFSYLSAPQLDPPD